MKCALESILLPKDVIIGCLVLCHDDGVTEVARLRSRQYNPQSRYV